MATILLSVAVNAGLYFLSRALAPTQKVEGPKLKEAQITSSTEGVPIPRPFGYMRLGGNLIWATNFTETKTVKKEGGGKGGGGGGTQTTTYTYDCSFAIAFGEGSAATQLGRVWADGKVIDLSKHTVRFYPGSDTQEPDDFMEGVEGIGNVPAYRGVTYLMFERFPLEDYGNRIPQITAEIIKPLDDVGPNDLEELVEGVCLIPASGEFAYATESYLRDDGRGGVVAENVHNSAGIPNMVQSMNLLEQSAPNMGTVLLVVSWFGNDLRVGNCTIRPKVEFQARADYESDPSYIHYIGGTDGSFITIHNDAGGAQDVDVKLTADGSLITSLSVPGHGSVDYEFTLTGEHTIVGVNSPGGSVDTGADLRVDVFRNEAIFPRDWQVSGVVRRDAQEVVRLPSGALVYGGTPSDISIKEAIQDIKARGWRVIFYPFILMDQLEGNGLPDPYGGAEQQKLPWRGRITCHPAAGEPGTVDKTAAAGTQVSNFFGSASVSHVPAGADGLPAWTGSASDWGYRRMVLHYARLCQMAGGVDGFLIGTELRGITRIRDSATNFPGVTALKTLAADVSTIMGSGPLVGYAADWSEYSIYNPGDGTGDVFFNLDPLWADPNIDFIGVDNYVPLSDWRDGTAHADYDEASGVTNPYVMSYLKGNILGGEGYDWFYASDSDRENQVRTPITDGAYGKPWVYRNKDFPNFWTRQHYNRPGGVESGTPTAWVPESKPIWFTEFGCPAIDKGPNQPNVFYDPKSSESAVPYFSSGRRDDLIQRRYLEAMLQFWRDNGGAMVDPSNMFIWTWDARPYPEFPFRSDVWNDSENWRLGHWITGRLGIIPLALLVEHICKLGGLTSGDIDVSGLYGSGGIVRGYVVDDIMSPRDMLEPLMAAYSFDGYESEGLVKFNLKSNAVTVPVTLDQLVTTEKDPGGYSLTRAQETELPAVIKVAFYDEASDYDQAAVDGRKLTGNSLNVKSVEFPMVLTLDYARSLADIMIHEAWASRDRGEFAVPNSLLRIDPGDVIRVEVKGREFNLRVTGQEAAEYRSLEVQGFDQSVFDELDYGGGAGTISPIQVVGRSVVEFADLPLLTGEESRPQAPRVVAYQSPWPGAVNVYQDDLSGGWELDTQVLQEGVLGETVSELKRGPVGRWDTGNSVVVDLYSSDQMLGQSDAAVLAGSNAVAIQNSSGGWEIFQFASATLVGTRRYLLSRLLRGQLGTETEMRDPHPVGSRIIFIDATPLVPLDIAVTELNTSISFRYGPASLPIDDSRYQDEVAVFRGVGLQPYAPVHLRAARSGANIALSWVRRTRFNGDSWDVPDVPLNEESERYEVDIMNGSNVVRTLTATTPSATYTSAQEVADFGSTQSTLTFRVYQISATVGRGRAAQETADV